ncbi:FCD domain-containing protein [Mycobacterium sp. 236(2023)]|uniref:FadR/GntR family transcriptional regulator n=1 Tax=Mycobacterium sp. 236(2023) TaxID=3038163 RepID=UPI0024151135|nr:FCD domain-containing protein [Mycobacterium sp. 236(2023)]MDG4668047.1 FCD domain-containing protein [Mycobacterium sp. 236(2023)]
MAEVIAGELRSRILKGEFAPGESLLSEAVLMEQYEVSRPTLREALRLLEAQGLITVRRGSHRGPVVNLPDGGVAAQAVAIQLQLREATLADVYKFRTLYEPSAARLAAETATVEGIQMLRDALDQETDALGDDAAFAEAAWQFHSVLMAVSGNATMAVVTECLQHISAHHSVRGMQLSADQMSQQKRAFKAHRKLVELIEQGDGAEAETFWARHMELVRDVQANWLQDQLITELLD